MTAILKVKQKGCCHILHHSQLSRQASVVHVHHNIENVQIENIVASENLSYDRAISNINTSSLPAKASHINQLKPTLKDNHQVQVEYNVINGSTKNSLMSKSVSCDCAIYPAIANYTTNNEQHKNNASDSQLYIKDTEIYKTASDNLDIHSSPKKYKHI